MNLTVLTGNLTRNPERTTTNSGMAVCRFTIANNRGFGEKQKTSFINIVTFSKTAENCEKYLSKGSKVGIVGELEIRQYTDNEGHNRYMTEVIANEVEFLSSKSQSEQTYQSDSNFEEIVDEDISDSDLPF